MHGGGGDLLSPTRPLGPELASPTYVITTESSLTRGISPAKDARKSPLTAATSVENVAKPEAGPSSGVDLNTVPRTVPGG
jgi:hypothetical protein